MSDPCPCFLPYLTVTLLHAQFFGLVAGLSFIEPFHRSDSNDHPRFCSVWFTECCSERQAWSSPAGDGHFRLGRRRNHLLNPRSS